MARTTQRDVRRKRKVALRKRREGILFRQGIISRRQLKYQDN